MFAAIARLGLAASLLLSLALQTPQRNTTLEYPQWRGTNRDGAASGFVAPRSWPDTLTRRWQTTVGEGYATPIVIGDTVYCFTRRDGREVLTALDAATGRERWSAGYAAPYSASNAASAHGTGPKATPAFHDGRVFTLGVSGIVAAFDAVKGTLAWRSAAPEEPPYFGAAASPVVEGGLVLTHPGNYGPLTAFDVASGAIKWTAGGDGFFASPLVATIAGVRQAITVTQADVIGVAIDGGAVLWRHAWPGGEGGTMPVLNGSTIIVGGLNAGVAAFTPRLRDGRWTVEPEWTMKDVTMYVSNPVVVADTIFGFSRRASGQFVALDAKTGAVLWLGPPRAGSNSAIAKAGDLLFMLNDDGELIVARSNRATLDVVKLYQVATSATWAQPAISGNRIFVKDVETVTLWTVD